MWYKYRECQWSWPTRCPPLAEVSSFTAKSTLSSSPCSPIIFVALSLLSSQQPCWPTLPLFYLSEYPVRSKFRYVPGTSSLNHYTLGPDSVNTASDLNIAATLTNTGDEAVKVLHHPHSALSTLPGNIFSIYHTESGVEPAFSGVKAKYVPQVAAAKGAYTTLSPGQSVTVQHNRKPQSLYLFLWY